MCTGVFRQNKSTGLNQRKNYNNHGSRNGVLLCIAFFLCSFLAPQHVKKEKIGPFLLTLDRGSDCFSSSILSKVKNLIQ